MTRQLLTIATIAAFLLAPASADDRPNIVWIIADDLSSELGCYGYQGVDTPNIDRLAKQGARYTNAFATAPVCSSSRSALITGVYQTTTGTHHHRTINKKPLRQPIQPITQLLRRSGYFVCNGDSNLRKRGKEDYNFRFDGDLYDAVDWSIGDRGRKAGQPFFAQVQIHEPHRDFVKAKDPARANDVQIPSYYPEHPVVRTDWANYLASIEVLDKKVGAVLDRIDKEGLTDNTVVFFFGDHGRPHYRDKQWLYDGGLGVPLVVRWPGKIEPAIVRNELVSLIDVSAATIRLAGVELPDWMHGRDMLEKTFAGHEMIFAARDRLGSTLDRVRCVRTNQYKYIRNFYPERPYSQHSGYKTLQYPGLTAAEVLHRRDELTGAPAIFWSDRRPREELYDVVADPEELVNLAGDPKYEGKLKQLRDELDRWIQETNDQGRIAEADVEATIQSSDQWYLRQMEKRGLRHDVAPETYLKWWEKELGSKIH